MTLNKINKKIFKNYSQGKIGAIIQARMGSERLPGKSLAEVGGKPIVKHIIENLKASQYLSLIVLATTKRDEDKALVKLAENLGVFGFTGSENDVLARYKDAAEDFELDIIVRITGDNILTDVDGMDQTIALYLEEKPDMAVNGGKQGYPLGTAVEVLSTNLLQKLNKTAKSAIEREHVTLHIYRHQNKYRISYLKAPDVYKDLDVRLTIDTPEDLLLIRQLYKNLKKRNEDFKLPLVTEYLKNHQEFKKINFHIKQRIL
jgi:spore coat polysaccharide biosynthesis protein SpsF|tara:strand:- start:793 stop:1572 length:780 start_codon:yes stop_codon:yes gene_type:complete